MDLNIKIQELRKKNNMSQEELAKKLYVSRAAISKWESGRGYPNIESLKNLSKIFSISIDELLSNEELIFLAEEDSKQTKNKNRDLFFGLLDICVFVLFFLPVFAQRIEGTINEVAIYSLTTVSPYLKNIYLLIIVLNVIFGVLLLALQNYNAAFWLKINVKTSLSLNILGMLFFTISLQPYPAILLFIFFIIKIISIFKN